MAEYGGDPSSEPLHERLAPAATLAQLRAGEELVAGAEISIPLDAVATLTLCQHAVRLHVGFAGRGDVIGIQAVFGGPCPPISARVVRAGSVIRLPRPVLDTLMRDDPMLRERLAAYMMRSTAGFLGEAAKSVALTIERRAARWIGRCRAAMADDLLPVTHQEVATALGVRRSGVTVALHVLEGEGLIHSRRGRILVVDAQGLKRFWRSGTARRLPTRYAGPIAAE
jgi:CRP-like cAMP-binding protein